MFKLALIRFFNWIVENNYQNIVKICIVAHDEMNVECPKEMGEEVTSTLKRIMIESAKPFCPNCPMDADVSRMSRCHTNFSIENKIIMEKDDVVTCINGTFFNLTKGSSYPENEVKGYKNYIKEDGPLPTYWVHE